MQISTGSLVLNTGPQKKSNADLCIDFHAYIAAKHPSSTRSDVPPAIDQKWRFRGVLLCSIPAAGLRCFGLATISETSGAAYLNSGSCDQLASSREGSSTT